MFDYILDEWLSVYWIEWIQPSSNPIHLYMSSHPYERVHHQMDMTIEEFVCAWSFGEVGSCSDHSGYEHVLDYFATVSSLMKSVLSL
jgi:hypothetical protein